MTTTMTTKTTMVVMVLVSTPTLVVTVLVSTTTLHVEVWVRLHLESRSSLATWTILLPDFMYYVIVLKDLSYVTAQCSGAQAGVGFPTWGTVNIV
ncbi:hypothetical protein L6452_38933 [Arctium lappa]|uniref:Uncharacterized protein n=1 Tax=Arctium lappa TaxID=4217 RepID=A0ACB8XS33_ARCLA|nr:hypothetical protein L6452_38933 [Arctium lappa]